jgi:hypothetical protein
LVRRDNLVTSSALRPALRSEIARELAQVTLDPGLRRAYVSRRRRVALSSRMVWFAFMPGAIRA